MDIAEWTYSAPMLMVTNITPPESSDTVPTIGFLIHDVAGGYQYALLSGVADRSEERGINLICFGAGELHAPQDFYNQRNILFEFISSQKFDGLIITGSIVNYASAEEAEHLYTRFNPVPVVSLSLEMKGIPSIVVDNQAGMKDMIRHLIDVHNRRKIVFIQGVEGNPDADQRYQAYLETLADYNIPFDSRLVLRADFFVTQSIQAVYTLLDEHGVSFDAIVAANDLMAFGALQALQNRGLRVPKDVVVVGFDNIDESNFTLPPLTTVQQPLHDMGGEAVDLLLKRMQGQQVPDLTALPTTPVIRQSCGCFSQFALHAASDEIASTGDSLDSLLTRRHDDILAEITRALGNAARNIDPRDIENLLTTFSGEVVGATFDQFLSSLDDLGHSMILKGVELAPLQRMISILRKHTLTAEIDRRTQKRLDDLWQQSRVMLAEIAERTQAYRSLQIRQQAQTLVEVARDLVNAADLDSYMEVVAVNLPRLGIEACYLSLYDKEMRIPKGSRLMMAYDQTGRIQLEPGGKPFLTNQLVPAGTLTFYEPSQYLVEALHFQEEQFGFVIFKLDKNQSLLYEELRQQLSSSLKSLFMAEEHKKIEANLVELNRLKTEFISTATHELRTPLTSIQGFSEILLTRELDNTRQKRYVTLINQQAGHLATIINDLLDISRLESNRKLEFAIKSVDMAELVNLVVGTFGETSQRHRIEVRDLEDCPLVIGDPFRITQVLDNLVSNAIKYSPEGGKVIIQGRILPNYFQISIQDQGIGMTQEQQAHLFEKFYRANASNTAISGTGLGLAISKLIVDLLGGKIWAESQLGVGTTFFFTLPLANTSAPTEPPAPAENHQASSL